MTNLVVVLVPQRRQVLGADVADVLEVLALRLVAVLYPFHLLGAVVLDAVHLVEDRTLLHRVNSKFTDDRVEENYTRFLNVEISTPLVMRCTERCGGSEQERLLFSTHLNSCPHFSTQSLLCYLFHGFNFVLNINEGRELKSN